MDKLINLEELKKISIGKILQEQLEIKHADITEFARTLGYKPRTIYNWYDYKSLHLEDAVKASHFMGYNLLKHYYRPETIILPPKKYIAVKIDSKVIDLSALPDSIRHLIESKIRELYVTVEADAENVDLLALPDCCRFLADCEKLRLTGL